MQKKLKEKEEIDSFKSDLDTMKNEINEIKSLLYKLVEDK